MNAEDKRARFIVKGGEKYLNLRDMKDALNNDKFIEMCAVMLAVGYKLQDPWIDVVRRCLGRMLMTLAGEEKTSNQ